MSDEIMSAEHAASFLSLSESAVYKLLQLGEIPGAKVGGQWRVRRGDLERSFDLARARATAQQREKTAPEVWEPAMVLLKEQHQTETFVLTRCLWCPEFVPAWEVCRYTTLCSFECAAELRTVFKVLGWSVSSDLTLSPLYRALSGDGSELMLGPWHFEAEQHGFVPDHKLTNVRYAHRHERGPLRELLLLEHPGTRARTSVPAATSDPPTTDDKASAQPEGGVPGSQ